MENMKKSVKKAQAVQRVKAYLCDSVRKLKLKAEDDPQTLSSIYRREKEKEACWAVTLPSDTFGLSRGDQMGASHVILVSKVTGKIIFSGRAGE
jgi:hypothetical protein